MRGKICIAGIILLLLASTALIAGSDLYAYHTKVQHSSTDYMGKYSDIIVVVGDVV